MNKQKEWQVELKRRQRATQRRRSAPIALQKTTLMDNIAAYKLRLKDALASHDAAKIKTLVERLIELRSEQAGLALLEYKEKFGDLNEAVVRQASEAYFTDCYRLNAAIGQA